MDELDLDLPPPVAPENWKSVRHSPYFTSFCFLGVDSQKENICSTLFHTYPTAEDMEGLLGTVLKWGLPNELNLICFCVVRGFQNKFQFEVTHGLVMHFH